MQCGLVTGPQTTVGCPPHGMHMKPASDLATAPRLAEAMAPWRNDAWTPVLEIWTTLTLASALTKTSVGPFGFSVSEGRVKRMSPPPPSGLESSQYEWKSSAK